MGVYVVKEQAPWWAQLAAQLAGAAGTGLVKGMFDRDSAARQNKADEAKDLRQHQWEAEKFSAQNAFSADEARKAREFAAAQNALNRQNQSELARLNQSWQGFQNQLNRQLERDKLANALNVAGMQAKKAADSSAMNRQTQLDVANIRADAQRMGNQRQTESKLVSDYLRELDSSFERTPESMTKLAQMVSSDNWKRLLELMGQRQWIKGVGGVSLMENPLYVAKPQEAPAAQKLPAAQGLPAVQKPLPAQTAPVASERTSPAEQATPQSPLAAVPAKLSVSNHPLAAMAKKYGVSPEALEEFIRAKNAGM